jgi:proteasome lid subunit RPN8/RPN11
MMLFENLKPEIVAHAEEVFPEECLGVIVDGRYVRLKNVSPQPEKSFEMAEGDELKYVFPDNPEDKAQALVHSHPDGPLWPSEPDMRAQVEGDIVFVTIGHSEETGWDYWEMGDHLLDAALDERPFRHGAMDCYEAIRSWFWQEYGIKIIQIPRRDKWWLEGEEGEPVEDVYVDHFQEAGFREMTAEEIAEGPRKGDCFFFKLNPAVEGYQANTIETHAGVYCGDGRIYHHLPGRLSAHDNAEQWGRKASRWLRYVGEGAEKLEEDAAEA